VVYGVWAGHGTGWITLVLLEIIQTFDAKGCGVSGVQVAVDAIIIIILGQNTWTIVLLWLNYDPNLVLHRVIWPTTKTFRKKEENALDKTSRKHHA
jgi:hypothetical protein